MKRLLTYGLLLLTILASHFVVSACQDDLPETTEVMVTFTTRTFEKEEGGATDAITPEKMKDLRVIVLDGDNIVIGNDIRTDIEQKSVVFSYSTLVSDGETFKFLAIANEESAGLATYWADIEPGSKMTDEQIYEWKTRTISNNLNPTADAPLPQSKFWTWTSREDAPDPNATLDYAASKISVQFKNETNAVQSLTDIKITGIGSATNAYLFAQEGNDFAEQQKAPSDIVFANVENLNPGATSTIQNYYSNPVSNISNPMLYATWMGEQRTLSLSQVKDKDGNTISLTSLKRNEYLQILVTLTGDGPVVNYTIHSWEDNNTNIGDTAPTIPGNDDGNGYNTEDWTAGNDIEIGGGGGFNDAPTFVPEGTVAIFDWTKVQPGENNWKTLSSILPNDITLNDVVAVGNVVAIEFTSKLPNEQGSLYFVTGHHNANNPHYLTTEPYSFTGESTFIVHFAFSENMNGFTIQNVRDQDLVITNTPNILISKLGVFKPNS